MESYVDLVRRRLQERHDNIIANMDQLGEQQLRFTMRIFGDCLDQAKRQELLGKYTEYWNDDELREFAKVFVRAYTEYAIAELEDKKKDGERFDPPHLTQEEYQEMAVREKWPRIAGRLADVAPLQLRREIARMGMLFRPYMLSDPGFNEGVLEFVLYFDLLARLGDRSVEDLHAAARKIATLVERAVPLATGEECERLLREIRTIAARAAGIEADPETLLGPGMERYPREAPPGWKQRELRKTLDTMNLKDLRLSSLVHIDLLTTDETRDIVAPFISRYPSFYEIPSKGLKELILAVADKVTDRTITSFFDRYSSGVMAMTPPVSYLVWKLMPEEEKILRLREDNAKMDSAMMSRHLARFLCSSSAAEMSDAGRQIALLTDKNFITNHGSILKILGGGASGDRLKTLYDEVTLLAVRMMSRGQEERAGIYADIRSKIAEAAGSGLNLQEGG